MANIYVSWGISALVLILAAGWIGKESKADSVFGILVDNRLRYSLSQLQLVIWTIVILSFLSGLFITRLIGGVESPLNIKIPNEVLIIMGISIGSAVSAGAIKASKDIKNVSEIKDLNGTPKFTQLFFVEEGSGPPNIIDVTRFQNFWITLIVVVAYVFTVITYIDKAGGLGSEFLLPSFDGTVLTLLGISHAGYLANKIHDKK